jgi:NTP pyrophosphatase (non-canonical NTP hydrolase)
MSKKIKNKENYMKTGLSFNALMHNIQKWGRDRNIDTLDPVRQLDKLQEEVDELKESMSTNNEHEIKDAIGDITVVLNMLCLQMEIDYEESLNQAFSEIKDRKGMVIEGLYVKYDNLTEEQKEELDGRLG